MTPTPPTHLLGTDTVVELVRGRADHLLPRLDAQPAALAVSTITVAELDYGVETSRRPDALRQDIEAMLTLLAVLPFDRAAARQTGLIRHALAVAGTPIGPYDTLIAGHACSLGLVLVTHNTREFRRVPGLVVEDWLAG